MPKRKNGLFDNMLKKPNVVKAFFEASKGKKEHDDVKAFLEDVDHNSDKIIDMLKSGFKASPKTHFTHKERTNGKVREISTCPFFPDRVVHWLAMDQLVPIIQRGMDAHSCGCVPGRGGSEMKRYVESLLRNHPKETKYCLKWDIHHFYPSISIDRLMAKLRRVVKDERFLEVIHEIHDGEKGLDIGLYPSQWLANFYLQDFDHFIREKSINRPFAYARYVDDGIAFAPNRRKLKKLMKEIIAFLEQEGLEVKPTWRIFNTHEEEVDICGWRISSDGSRIRKRVWKNVRATILRVAHHKATLALARRMMSYIGWLKHGRTRKVYSDYPMKEVVAKCKNLIRKVSKNAENRKSALLQGA